MYAVIGRRRRKSSPYEASPICSTFDTYRQWH